LAVARLASQQADQPGRTKLQRAYATSGCAGSASSPSSMNKDTQLQPNVLLVVSDQHRGDWIEWAGASFVNTPNISRLQESGVVFKDAICPAPLCVPSRICMARGQNYGLAKSDCQNGVALDNDGVLPMDGQNLYSQLRDAGYSVGACGKSDLRKELKTWGPDGLHVVDSRSAWHDLGFTHGFDSAGKHDGIWAAQEGIVEPYLLFLRSHGLDETYLSDFSRRPFPNYLNTTPTPLPDFAYGDNYVAANAMATMQQMIEEGRPWFMQVNFMGPHEPMDVTETMKDTTRQRKFPLPPGTLDIAEDEYQEIAGNYVAMIENIDRQIGHFLTLLEDKCQIENTVIIYCSDHGEMLGEKGKWAKLVPYAPSIGVPLVISGPEIRPSEVTAPVSLIDLTSTILELAQARPLRHAQSESLRPYLHGETVNDETAVRVSGMGPWRGIQSRDYKLVVGYRDGLSRPEIRAGRWSGEMSHPMLFDRHADPHEQHNLADVKQGVVQQLFARLQSNFVT